MKNKRISIKELEEKFDKGEEDVLQYFDLSKATFPNLEPFRVNVDLPRWMITRLDMEADRLGVTRQSIIKVWLGEKLDSEEHCRSTTAASATPKSAKSKSRTKAA